MPTYPSALGTVPGGKRIIHKETSYPIVQGLPITAGQTVKKNMLVRLLNDGTVSPVTAATQRPLGRVASDWQGDDKGNVRVVTPWESMLNIEASGTLDEGNEVAYTGALNADGRPIYKAAATGDFVVGVALQPATTGQIAMIGLSFHYYVKA